MSTIESAITRVKGHVGVGVKHFSTGKVFRHNATERFFTASTLKVPLLVELYRQVDRGKVDLFDRVDWTDDLRVSGSGILKEMGIGLQPTVRDLALLMIIISDNSATDYLYNLVGRDSLNAAMETLGLSHTSIPMTCRELLYSAVGMNVSNPDHPLEEVTGRLARNEFVMDSDAFREDRSDVSSPDDMVRLLELVHEADILSPSSREGVLDILNRQQLKNIIPHALPPGTPAAHKTGSYSTVRCDVGIVTATNGPYAVAIMVKNLEERDRMKVDLSLAAVSRAVYDTFLKA